jgi:AraC-like DNA-binding protein
MNETEVWDHRMPGSFAPSPAYAALRSVDGPSGRRPPRRLQAYAALTAAAFVSYILGHVVAGPIGLLLAAVGASACGWSWRLSRALFDPAEREARWPLAVMVLLLASGAGSRLLDADGGVLFQAVGNIYALVGSAALLLTFVEPLNGWRTGLSATETRFRIAFLAVYALLVAASILLLRDPGGDPAEAERIAMIKTVCALTGLLTGGAAVWFRARHPLAARIRGARSATPDDRRLAERIERLLREEQIHATPDLKVADLARRLGQPEYRVTQCITAAMGFPNFNRLINHHRIARAKQLLADPDSRDLSILQIAFDCGFGSVGPFNRAFKDEAGTTPRAYRADPSSG